MLSTKTNEGIRRTMLLAAAVLFAAVASPAIAGGHAASPDRMVNGMAKRLSLTDAQVALVRQIFDAHHDQMKAQFQALRTAREALRQATVVIPVNEGAIRNAAQALAQAEGDAALLRAQVRAQIVPLLNADQQQKFATFGTGPRGAGWGHRPASE
jgi:Spy/CpxP family protein refolding chaperone